MSSAKLAALCGLVAIVLTACGSTAKPVAGSAGHAGQHSGRGVVDDPRAKHLKCLRQHHLPATTVGQTGIQVGSPPDGATVTFAPTPGAAQQRQIEAQVVSAEVIGSALLYPNRASDSELKQIEDCLAVGVKG